jgi:hypothetical protein
VAVKGEELHKKIGLKRAGIPKETGAAEEV